MLREVVEVLLSKERKDAAGLEADIRIRRAA